MPEIFKPRRPDHDLLWTTCVRSTSIHRGDSLLENLLESLNFFLLSQISSIIGVLEKYQVHLKSASEDDEEKARVPNFAIESATNSG